MCCQVALESILAVLADLLVIYWHMNDFRTTLGATIHSALNGRNSRISDAWFVVSDPVGKSRRAACRSDAI